ncbi:MAG: hypothetical protein KY468_05675 [Armatimonadetes bacterium]|nr:hypothetical protein [Armatimonadota bacterium]
MTVKIFRSLIVMNWLSILLGAGLGYATEPLLPPELKGYLDRQADILWSVRDTVITIGSLIYLGWAVIVYVGLFLFKSWAKSLYLPMLVIEILLTPLFGPTIDMGIASIFYDASMIIEGILVATVYIHPISSRFGPHEPPLSKL